MLARLLAVVTAAIAVLGLATPALAATPAGPRLAVAQLGPGYRSALLAVGPTGAERSNILVNGRGDLPEIWSGAAWSPDGSRLVFSGLTSLQPTRSGYPKRLFVLAAEGGKPRALKGTEGGVSPVFSPDGHTVAFAKEKAVLKLDANQELQYASASIWLTDLETGESRQLTPWRNRLRQYPSSFSPDGSVLAFTRYVAAKPPEAIGINFDGSAASVLVRGSAFDPVFSPDGTRIAFARGPTRQVVERELHPGGGKSTTYWQARLGDLYTVRYGGGELRRLTRTPRLDESEPTWDPSGRVLAYVEAATLGSPRESSGAGARIVAINADGSCATELLDFGLESLVYAPSWQPGPGREAPPLIC